MDIIVTSEDQLTKIIDGIVERRLTAILTQHPVTVTPPLKQGNYTSKDIQELFNLKSPVSVWQWEKKGLLKPIIIQRKKTYLRKDIQLLIEQKTLNKRA